MITFSKLGRLGQFGNQLFQYAGTRLYAEKNGFNYCLPAWIGSEIFMNIKPWTKIESIKSFFCEKIHLDDHRTYTKNEILPWLFSKSKNLPDLKSLKSIYEKPRDNIDFYGYMQDELSFRLLAENRDKVKAWFNFSQEINEEFSKKIETEKPWIGIHIRKGDYVKIGIDISIARYKKALDKIIVDYPNHNVFVATNDRSVLAELKDYPTINPQNPIKKLPPYLFDFWMLINADIVISGGSTFSWWAAFLSNKDRYYSTLLTHLWEKGRDPEFDYRIF